MAANNQSSIVSKCTAILDILAASGEPLGFTEIVEKSQFVKSSTHRILSILQSEGLAEYDARGKTYRLGPKLMNWALMAWRGTDLQQAATADLKNLCELSGSNIVLAILDDSSALYLRTENTYNLRYVAKAGDHAPIHCTAVGKVLAAYLPETRRKNLIEDLDFERYTEFTLTRREDFESDMEITMQRGYSINNREEFLQVCGIAAPIFDFQENVVASISIWSLFEKTGLVELEKFAPVLLETSTRISRRLGYHD